jgi:NAD(P) transhydrogenase subunit beta
MTNLLNVLLDLSVVALFLAGVAQFRNLHRARFGNLTAAFALICSVLLVLYRHGILDSAYVAVASLAGCSLGWWIAARVNMVQIPAMVAFQHGAGGVAAFLVAYRELTRTDGSLTALGAWSGHLGLIIGAATFSGSMIASGKLANHLQQTPVTLPAHNATLLALLGVIGLLCLPAAITPGGGSASILVALILVSMVLGGIFAVRIGGADMPVLISFLNATAGLAAAFCGVSIGNRLLAACGATVVASGSILTHQMCLAMNRPLAQVFLPRSTKHPERNAARGTPSIPAPQPDASQGGSLSMAVGVVKRATTIMIIPGYGMAQAQAQFETVWLANRLREMGKQVKFAIHPIAGRMPGHMHVVLAEAEADPDMLVDIRDANPEFQRTDVAVIVGACDVVNPAAIGATGTPISGMPILKAHEAHHVIVCNLDGRPGYSGVENSLYAAPNAILLFGDARATLQRLIGRLAAEDAVPIKQPESMIFHRR